MSAVMPVEIDRRADYYARVGAEIARDALAFYVRAERGRVWQREFVRVAFPDLREQLLAGAPCYDPGELELDQFAASYSDLSHGA